MFTILYSIFTGVKNTKLYSYHQILSKHSIESIIVTFSNCKKCGITSQIISMIKQIYRNRTSKLRFNNELTISIPTEASVLQDDALSAILFSISVSLLIPALRLNLPGLTI